ncbi:MAG TPA: hypothetical protein VHI13_13225 [Candidatus Kapabacteria bacterium]|nr:hypothetical protein [Candidatus Kapabacteria bacterium]
MNLHTFTRGLLAVLAAAVLMAIPPTVRGGTAEKQKKEGGEKKEEVKKGSTIQRVPRNAYEVIKNKVSNIEVYSSNYGIFGLNVQANQAGGVWPRGSGQAYIFGGGIWFGAQKVRPNGDTNKLCVIGYNPNSGASWMVPGVVTEPLVKSVIDESADAVNKYRLYFSTDYNSFTGKPFDAADISGPAWPIWDTDPNEKLKFNRYFGNYIEDVNLRSRDNFPKGPAMISGEDIVSLYKDTDLGKYERIARDSAIKKGYPIGIQVQQTIYSWGFGKYADFLFIKYTIVNKSGENLLNCYMAPALDMDIGSPSNDHNTIAIPNKDDDSLNLAIQWSESESKPYGYIGLDFLESPSIDARGFIRHDKRVFTEKEQVGLSVFQNWPIEEDPTTPEARYAFISDRTQRDVDIGPGDRRFLMSTGPFNMAAGDTARVVVGIMFAYGADANGRVTSVATGTESNRKFIYDIDRFAQKVYDENFLVPVPPDPAQVTWHGLNGGVELSWDDRSERSLDMQERGLDFAGYTIKRGRRTVGFSDADSTQGWNLGFKTIGGFQLPPLPDSTARYTAGSTGKLSYLGPWYRLPMLAGLVDTMYLWSRKPKADTLVHVVGLYPDSLQVFRYDTLKRPGSSDSVFTNFYHNVARYGFTFDPYDDINNDSTLFNDGRYGDKFKNKAIRDIVRDALTEIMDSVTGGRHFVDVGDDNGDATITSNSSDLAQNERLINNVDYYYQVLAYDAGSAEGTPSKTNAAIAGINEVRANPEGVRAGVSVNPTIISSDGLGGIHNFRFNVLDNQRLSQMFAGDTIDFVWEPTRPMYFLPDSQQKAGLFLPQYFYVDRITAYSRKTKGELMHFAVQYGDFTDHSDSSASFRILDSGLTTRQTDTGLFVARNVSVPYNLSYDADPLRPQYNTVGAYKNTFSVGFDYAFTQFGDSLRIGVFGDSTFKKNPFEMKAPGGANANLVAGRSVVSQNASVARSVELQGIPSIGQPKLEIEFAPGGTETITINKNNKDYQVPVNYLTVKVRNVATFNRTEYDASSNSVAVPVQYNYEFTPDPLAKLKADTTNVSIEISRVISRKEYALYAFGWLNADKIDSATRRNQFARGRLLVGIPGYKSAIGTPGRYYYGTYTLPGTDTTLRFTHSVVVNGSEIYIDFAGMGSIESRVIPSNIPSTVPSTDFQAGDKFDVNFTGGTLGLPQPGAKVSVAIPDASVKLDQMTDGVLDQVNIVPNPYLVDHIAQPTNTDRRLFFTHLPSKCTIQLYTESGELLQTLDHDATTGNGENERVGVEVWDLLTKANRQAQSQLIIARISTPNGAETIKKVAIVVGGYRLNSR